MKQWNLCESVQSCDKVAETLHSVDVQSDVTAVVSSKGNGSRQSEQLLPDYYVRDYYVRVYFHYLMAVFIASES